MLAFIMGLPGMISGLFGTINHLTDAISNEKIVGINAKTEEDRIASDERVKTLEMRRDLKLAEVGHPFEPEKLAFYVVLFYMAKVMVWDAALHLGVTDPVHGDVQTWAELIVLFYFGTGYIRRLTK